jgi:hypothetical protein
VPKGSRTLETMAPVATAPVPGNLTVPPLFGWQDIVVLMLLVIAAAVAFLVVGAGRAGRQERSDWQAFLDARSRSDSEAHDESGELVGPDPGR